MNFININKYKNYNHNLFLIFSLIGIILRIWISQFGSNFDFEVWENNLEIFKQGKSVWSEGLYSYGSPWLYTTYILEN